MENLEKLGIPGSNRSTQTLQNVSKTGPIKGLKEVCYVRNESGLPGGVRVFFTFFWLERRNFSNDEGDTVAGGEVVCVSVCVYFYGPKLRWSLVSSPAGLTVVLSLTPPEIAQVLPNSQITTQPPFPRLVIFPELVEHDSEQLGLNSQNKKCPRDNPVGLFWGQLILCRDLSARGFPRTTQFTL